MNAFLLGMLFMMVCDIGFSIANYFVQKAYALRAIRTGQVVPPSIFRRVADAIKNKKERGSEE